MAILKIARMGHPVLRRPADPVADPGAPEIARLIRDMVDTMVDADGAGLAAPQVHVPLRLVVFRPPAERSTEQGPSEQGPSEQGPSEQGPSEHGQEDEPAPLTVLINPEITPLGDQMEGGWEGCLSLPGFMGWVPRHAAIHYRGLDANGHLIDRRVEGFHARVVQHECDHLDGILYPQRMPDLSRFGFVEEMRKGVETDP